MIRNWEEMMSAARQTQCCKVVVAGAEDLQILKAIGEATSLGMIDPIMVGEKKIILRLVKELNLPAWPIIDVQLSENAKSAIKAVNDNPGSLLMKGLVPTADLMKAVLDRSSGIRGEKLLSHVAAVETPGYHKLLYITDGALNVDPDSNALEIITRNAIEFVKTLGNKNPKTGLIALVEQLNTRVASTVTASDVAGRFKEDEIVEGPVSLDIALSKAAAEKKGFVSRIAGETDILVMPDAMVSNVAVKILRLVGDGKIGGVIVGAKVPILLVSRSDDANSKLRSIALGIVYNDRLASTSTA